MSSAAPAGRAGFVLTVLAMLTALGPLSIDIYSPSLPAIESDLGASDWLAQASITGCLLGIGAGQVVWGPLSDRFGRRPVILIGAVGWTIACAASALVADAGTLVAMRIVAGLCGAACIVAARSVVRDITVEVHVRSARVGMLSMVSAAAPVVAPLIGTAVASVWGWRGDFVVSAIIGAALVLLFSVGVPETLPPGERSVGGLGIAGGLAAALRDRELLGITLSLAVFAVGFYAYIAAAAFIVERELGHPPIVFATVFGTNAVVMVGANLVFRRLVRRRGPRGLLGLGLAVGAGSGLLLLLAALSGAPDWLLWLASIVFAGSAGLVLPGAHAAGQATGAASGAASALTGAAQFLGGAVGSPLTGVIAVTAVVLGAILVVCSSLGVTLWAMIRAAHPGQSFS